MLAALIRAFDQLGDPALRRVLWIGFGAALASLVLLTLGAGYALSQAALFGLGWLDTLADVLGTLAALVLAVVLFPALAGLISSFLLDEVAEAVDRRYYPHLPPARQQRLGEQIATGLRFLAVLIVFNLLALVLTWVVPPLHFAVFLLVNGYLLGREYFELVALRRLDPAEVRLVRRRHAPRVLLAGVVIAALLAVPLLNLLVPVLATAFMVHIYQGLVRRV